MAAKRISSSAETGEKKLKWEIMTEVAKGKCVDFAKKNIYIKKAYHSYSFNFN